ncbi:LysM peptidoglycan-binding domain-containing protein [Streptomyces sp. NBC_00237]|uniref:BTAD domain-containing putative transcriptional regulator n=1 Tax=Streptomyces sp. NBC_00237 TaxID=2975687 RepID=UPI00224D0D54|nr:BTAD domain-containing putative transcriptional regulator [Streptomyces sp. NBC_00237]MCX5206899.1 LysM peptidoglycan-binding domain-containing protein [Streptomyces sp. NBC_00237]
MTILRRVQGGVRLVAAAVALAAAVGGIPYVLAVTVGVPWPERVASVGDLLTRLSQPVSDPFVLQVLALVGWVCWGYFLATLVRELCWVVAKLPALLRDATLLRRRTATLPAHRAAAALLVGTVLIGVCGLGRLPAASAEAHAVTSLAQPVAATALQQVLAATPAGAPRPAYTSYRVLAGDTLWDLAAQHLGDPLKWREIYQLSCTIRQKDGQLLSDPDLILPGWELHLPNLAGPPLPPSSRPSAPTVPSPRGDAVPAPLLPAAPSPSVSGGASESASPAARAGEEAHRPVAIGLGTASLIGVTTAAGIAAALGYARKHAARRRTPRLDALTAPVGEEGLLLADSVKASNRAYLAARAARHHTPDGPPRHTAPADPQPPGTVTLAESGGREVAVDVLAVPGGVHLYGDGARDALRALVIAIAAAAERLRPGPPHVRLIVPAPVLARLLPDAVELGPAWQVVATVGAALDVAEHVLLEHARHRQHLDVRDADAGPAFHILLLDGTEDTYARRLETLAGRAKPGELAVVTCQNTSPGTAWHTVTAAADGTAGGDLSALHQATLFLLAPQPAVDLLAALSRARDQHSPRTPAPSEADDETPAADGESPGRRSAVPLSDPPRPSEQASTPSVGPGSASSVRAVHIRLFSGFSLSVRGKECALAETRKEETREFLALLAAHPGGLRGEEIADRMQISGSATEVHRRVANLRRNVRRILRDATGQQEVAFVVPHGQRHRLDPQHISTDVAHFTDALQQAVTADSPYGRAEALQHATDTYTGPLCDGADYLWAIDLREALHRRAVDALALLADHTAQHSADPEPALALLNRAADLDPTNEHLYQRIIQLQLALDRNDAAQRTLRLLTTRLADIDACPDPATLALLHTAGPRKPSSVRG